MSQEGFVLITLLELWHGGVDQPLCLCSGPTETINVKSYDWRDLVTVMQRDYYPFGFRIGAIRREMEAMTPTLAIDVALTGDLLTLLSSNDLRTMTIVVKTFEYGVNQQNPDNIDIIYIGMIEEWAEKDLVMTLTCKDSTINYWIKNPKRQYSYLCGHPFKRLKCGYTGAESHCPKTLTACSTYGNQDHFGGFKDIWRQMRSAI